MHCSRDLFPRVVEVVVWWVGHGRCVAGSWLWSRLLSGSVVETVGRNIEMNKCVRWKLKQMKHGSTIYLVFPHEYMVLPKITKRFLIK